MRLPLPFFYFSRPTRVRLNWLSVDFDHTLELEGTRGVRTHAELLYPNPNPKHAFDL